MPALLQTAVVGMSGAARSLVAITVSSGASLTADLRRQGPRIESQLAAASGETRWRP